MILFLIFNLFININGLTSNSSIEDVILDSYGHTPLYYPKQQDYSKQGKQMEILSFNSFRYRYYKENNDTQLDGDNRGSFLDKGASLSMHLRQMANIELGVTNLQDAFNTLVYVTIKKDEEKELSKMIQSLEEKLQIYSSLVEEMTSIVKHSFRKFMEEKLKNNRDISSNNLILEFGHESGASGNTKQHEYYPCCIIPDHYLVYDPHFGTHINTELWCDSGLEQEKLISQEELFFTPLKLTEVFTVNHHLYPNLKWQFYMSASGLHTEFPAHRSGTSVGSDCGQSSRHHDIYEKTLRPNGRSIILLYDLGHTLRPRLLLTAKAIGHYIIDTLTQKDSVVMLGIADRVILPSLPCMQNQLLPATHDVKQSLRYFVDYLQVHDAPTNHSLGLEKALKLASDCLTSDQSAALIVYVTRGILSNLKEVQDTLIVVDYKMNQISANFKVVISAFGLGISQNEPSLQTQFLEALTKQEYEKFGIQTSRVPYRGEVIGISTTLRVAPVIKNFYDVVETPNKSHSFDSNEVSISDPYWDPQAKDMVLSLSQGVYSDDGEVIGVVGVDLSLSYLMEDVTYYSSPDGEYAFVVDSKGSVLSHPKIGRPESWSQPLLATPVTTIESSPSFLQLAPHILLLPSGHKRSKRNSKRDTHEYWWRRSEKLGWAFVLSAPSLRPPLKQLAHSVSPLPSHTVFHRLDLLSPQEAKVCRHFNQMATLDGSSLFISSGAYRSPSSYLSRNLRNLNSDSDIMAYLMDKSNLLANPGLKDGVREEAAALYHLSPLWRQLQRESKLQKYIVRRYGATHKGVTVTYPGTLMDSSFDPRSQEWFIRAVENPGKVVVSPPFLDPGGGGHVVAVSHSVFQGRSATLHSPSDPVQAVLAADFTLGYWHKLLVDIEPLCANSIYFKEFNQSESDKNIGVRCFLMNMSGYLVAHPSFVDPETLSHLSSTLPRHITHQEPVLSMVLLGKSVGLHGPAEPVLKKLWCSNFWKGSNERHYSFRLKVGQVVQSSETPSKMLKNERSCLQYKLTTVPASNLILGFINQTCSPATAFCPCSMVDRLCLNCQLMEKAACECPCECPLPSEPCFPWGIFPPIQLPTLPLPSQGAEERHKTTPNEDSSQITAIGSCPPIAETPAPLHYGVGMLSQLDECVPIPCGTHTSIHSCLGVLGCVWCVLNNDGDSPLETPYCTQAHNCYGGIRGGPSPYPPGLSPLPHSIERGSTLPIGPVAGGVLAVFVVMGLAIYFYRVYVGGTSRIYTPTTLQSQNHHSRLYPPEGYPETETGENESLDDGIITSSAVAAAAISPYRMNPGYRRPLGNPGGESSDHGYSTMTPHDESENLTYTDLTTASIFPASSMSADDRSSFSHRWSSGDSEPSHNQTTCGVSFHTKLSSPKRIGPNKVIVPVTVHMVDSV